MKTALPLSVESTLCTTLLTSLIVHSFCISLWIRCIMQLCETKLFMQNVDLDCSFHLCFSSTGLNCWYAKTVKFVKVFIMSCLTFRKLVCMYVLLTLNTRHFSSSWIADSIISTFLAFSFYIYTQKWRGRKSGVRFFQDSDRLLTQVPLVTVQLPANEFSKDRRKTYSLIYFYNGLVTGLFF